jgi:DNA-binding NtrC family response regulator
MVGNRATVMPMDEPRVQLEVLVVDDEPNVRELILAYFKALGIRAQGAQDGLSAIATLQRSRGRFRLVITDLNLPGADGFAVLQAARQASAECSVVIITGYASLDSAIQAVRVGAYDYLTKPFSIGQFDAILRRIHEGTNRSVVPSSGIRGAFGGGSAGEMEETRASDFSDRLSSIESAIERFERLLMRTE